MLAACKPGASPGSEGKHDARQEVAVTSEAAERKKGKSPPVVLFACLLLFVGFFFFEELVSVKV